MSEEEEELVVKKTKKKKEKAEEEEEEDEDPPDKKHATVPREGATETLETDGKLWRSTASVGFRPPLLGPVSVLGKGHSGQMAEMHVRRSE